MIYDSHVTYGPIEHTSRAKVNCAWSAGPGSVEGVSVRVGARGGEWGQSSEGVESLSLLIALLKAILSKRCCFILRILLKTDLESLNLIFTSAE